MSMLVRCLAMVVVLFGTTSCNNVGFQQKSSPTANTSGTGRPDGGGGGDTPTTTDPNDPSVGASYGWRQSGFGLCSAPCGTGNQAQIVDCRRSTDGVVVADSFCTGTKPVATQTCNANACVGSYVWNPGDYSACSKTCGGGVATRLVVCQNQSGQTVPDANCGGTRPPTQVTCGNDPCGTSSPAWKITPGFCPLSCANTVASVTDVVVCLMTDGSTAPDGNCPAPNPATTRACNQNACPATYTYAWTPGNYSDCSKTCGGGVQTRSLGCQRSDGAFVDAKFCDPNAKPVQSQACNGAACPSGTREVTQYATVTPASNQVDLVVIVDDSSSMKDDQLKLASRLGNLVADLDAANVDYQVCLTTTDVGYYQGSPLKWSGQNSVILNKSTPNKSQVFYDTINGLGAEWSSDEQAIKATSLMIQNFRASGCFRPQATLSTIVISDEDERSVGGDASLSQAQYQPLTPQNLPANLISLVHSTFDTDGFVKPFIWNSIIDVPNDNACMAIQDQGTSPSFWGKLYAQLSNSTGGAIGSICDNDYTQNLKFIKDRLVKNMPGLTLQCVPVDTPVVTFSPAVATSISTTGNQMKFSPALPENTQLVAKYHCAN